MEYLALATRFALAVAFALAGLAKLRHSQEFARVIGGYELLPPVVVPAVAVWLPRFEVAAGVVLLVGFLTVPAALALGIALVGFTAAVALALVRGREIDCGCFGTLSPRRITWQTVTRNLVFLAAAITVVLFPPRALSLDSVVAGASSPLPAGEALGVLVATTTALGAIALALHARRLGATAHLLEQAGRT